MIHPNLWEQLLQKVSPSEIRRVERAHNVVKGMITYLAHRYENALEDGINPELESIREAVRQRNYHTAIGLAERFYHREQPTSPQSLADIILEQDE